MLNVKERTELMDADMDLVNGGDYGDTDKDNGNEPRYKVGQMVEVYNSAFHCTTTRREIYAVKKLKSTLFSDTSFWIYSVTPTAMDDSDERWISADSIESK